MSLRRLILPLLVLLAGLTAGSLGCATACPASRAPAPPSEAEMLVASLTDWLNLDSAQQTRTLTSARQWVERNVAIRAGWERGERMRPQALLESRALFERDLLAILTPPQTEKIQRVARMLVIQGRPVTQ